MKEGRERKEGIQEVSATYKGYLGLLKTTTVETS